MFKRIIIMLLVFSISLIGVPNFSFASTSISGNVTGSTWTTENSPYIVSGDFEVSSGATLVIKPGVVVRLEGGAKIIVKGKLIAEGTSSDRIVFTSSDANPKRGDWGEIIFKDESSDESVIKYADIKYGGGVICDDSSPVLSNILFLNNTYGIKVSGDNGLEGKQIILGDESASDNSGIETINISDNEFSDNEVGIEVNRNNSNDYVNTPGGRLYQGDIKTTAVIENNIFSGNDKGIIMTKGNNNLIRNNTIKYSFEEALSVSSDGSIVEKNIINNNYDGLKIDGSVAIVLQNTIVNNSENGLILNDSSAIIKNNNIYKNKKYNLSNNAGIIDVSNNYWGSSISDTVKSLINNVNGVASYSPVKESFINIDTLSAPILNDYISFTNSSIQPITGIKTTGTAVYADGIEVVPSDDKAAWEYNMDLEIGTNKDKIYLKNSNGTESSSVNISVTREEIVVISEPTVNYSADTTKGSQVISGTKMGGTGIWINNSEVVSPSGYTDWSYELGLAKGENSYSILAEDSAGRRSKSINITITRGDIDVDGIISEEKSLSTEVDEALALRLAGRLLLQVERAGMIWYVNPSDNKRYYVTWDNALDLFRKFSTGISEENLLKFPGKGSGKEGDKDLRNRFKGKFLLRVESAGMISYIDTDGYRNDIAQDDLMNIFISLSLGISNKDLRKIEVGEIN